jgi:hypothetical protein
LLELKYVYGNFDNEKILDGVFSKFCIGKWKNVCILLISFYQQTVNKIMCLKTQISYKINTGIICFKELIKTI